MLAGVFLLGGRLYLSVIWGFASAGKPAEVSSESSLSRVLPKSPMLRGTLLGGLVGGEALLALFLAAGEEPLFTAIASAGVFLAFIVVKVSGRLKGSCGCLGRFQRGNSVSVHQVLLWAGISVALAIGAFVGSFWSLPLAPFVALAAVVAAGSLWFELRREMKRAKRSAGTLDTLVQSLREAEREGRLALTEQQFSAPLRARARWDESRKSRQPALEDSAWQGEHSTE